MSLKLDLSVSESMIQNAIAVGIAEAFSAEKRDALLRDIIRAHLSVKADNSYYTKETLLSRELGNIVRKMASEEVVRVVETMRPRVNEIVAAALGPAFQDDVFAQLRASLTSLTLGRISLSVSPVVPDDD